MIGYDELLSYRIKKERIPTMARTQCISGTPDIIEKPDHYNVGSIEAWDYILDSLGKEGFVYYCEGNVKKYLHRWRYKGTSSDDLRKARAYLDRMIELTEKD
jgi:hypothetical protein